MLVLQRLPVVDREVSEERVRVRRTLGGLAPRRLMAPIPSRSSTWFDVLFWCKRELLGCGATTVRLREGTSAPRRGPLPAL